MHTSQLEVAHVTELQSVNFIGQGNFKRPEQRGQVLRRILRMKRSALVNVLMEDEGRPVSNSAQHEEKCIAHHRHVSKEAEYLQGASKLGHNVIMEDTEAEHEDTCVRTKVLCPSCKTRVLIHVFLLRTFEVCTRQPVSI